MGRAIAALCGGISILLSGCSTIVKGTEQQVSIATPGVPSAMCTLTSPAVGTRTVQTPGTLILPKSRHNVAVACVAQCYSDGVGMLASEVEIMTVGNILFGGVIGLGIDAASGAMNKYQPGIEIAMTPIPNCGRPGKGRGVPMASTPAPRQGPPG
jgi:L-aminopeptidase/D-esterase-like protein